MKTTKVVTFFDQTAEKLPGGSLDQSAIKPDAANPQYRLGFMLCISGAGSLIRGGGRRKRQFAKP